MSKAGRPSVPAKLKELSGTLRKDRVVRQGVDYELIVEIPKPEVWLSDKGKKNFRSACEMLIGKELLNVANVQLVAMMAEEFATYEEACRELKDNGKTITMPTKTGTYEQVSPWIGIRNQAMKNYKDIATLFGMDPLSQQKLGPATKVEKDPFDETQKQFNEN
jgi:P27 family predicted phage terminase small subunit